MHRRSLLLGACALTPALAALAACNAITTTNGVTTIDVAKFGSDAQLVVTGIGAIVAQPVVATALGANMAKATAALAEAKTTAAEIAAAGGAIALSTAQGWVSTIVGDAQTVLGLVGGLSTLPPSVQGYVSAIEALLPLIQVAVQLLGTNAVGATPMSPVEARALLSRV